MLLPPKTAFVLFYLLYLIRAVLATVIGAWSSRSHAGRQVSPDGKGQLALSRHLAVHLGHRLTEPHASPPLHQLTGELQHVAGHHLPFEACIFDPAEERDFSSVFRQRQSVYMGHRPLTAEW